MGDRGNIKVGKVYLYTHWSGSDIKNTLLKALKRKQRWDDEPYLTRIIFCELLEGDLEGETGFGISTKICDNEHNIFEVDVEKQEVRELEYDWKKDKAEKVVNKWTFEQFVTKEPILQELEEKKEE